MDFNKELLKFKDKLSEMLFYGTASVVGIDIGLSAIKFCEVSQSGQTYKINKFLMIHLNEGVIIEDEIQKEDELIAALHEGIKQLGTSTKFAAISLNGPSAIIKKLQLAGGTQEEVEDQVMWEIEQYLPFPSEEGNISFHVIGENRGGGIDVIVGAAKKTVIASFKSVVESTGLKVKIVDIGAAATLNVFEKIYLDRLNEDKSYMIIDFGAQKTQLLIYKGKILSFFKEINIGGVTITEEIQRQMGVNYQEAEELKIDGDGAGNPTDEILVIVNQVLETLFTELKKTVEFYTSSSVDELFESCIITGGGSMIDGIDEAIEHIIECPVERMNPLEVFELNHKIPEDVHDDLASRGVQAIGLAMRVYQR